METIEKKPVVQGQTRQQLPWHKPLLQRLDPLSRRQLAGDGLGRRAKPLQLPGPTAQ